MNIRRGTGLKVAAFICAVHAGACTPAAPGDNRASGGATASARASASAATGPGSTAVVGGEGARVQAYLDSIYQRSDVRHSFRTRFGEDVDCVDFFAQPAVKALAARGIRVSQRPEVPADLPAKATPPSPAESNRVAVGSVFFDGQPDDNGQPRSCPDGSVPQIRLTAERIRQAGGLDAFTAAVSRPRPAPPTPGHPDNCDFPNYAHIVGALTAPGDEVYMGDSTMSIFAPNIPTGDHSVAQTWTYSGYNLCDGITSTIQSVEAGWNVDPGLYGDENSHLFVFSTTDGYQTTGCYNNWPGTGNCVPWVQSSSRYAPGMILPASVVNGAAHELEVLTININNWWIQITVDGVREYMGYYPASAFHGSMQTYADNFEVGGEVYDATGKFNVPMGSGYWPEFGLGYAAYHHDSWGWGSLNGQKTSFDNLTMVDARPNSYAYSTTATPGSGWANFFFFGNQFLLRRFR